MDSAQDLGPSDVPSDPVVDFDWAAHWRRLVEARESQAGSRPGFWDCVAPSFPTEPRADDILLSVLQPELLPERTLIDVGAGPGRYSVPLAGRLDWVTAVEPSEAMRARVPALPNLTVVASSWEDAEVAPADLVICAHVLYWVRDIVPFLRKLEASARVRVLLLLRDSEIDHPATRLWEAFTGERRLREPRLQDAYNLLHQLGIRPNVSMARRPLELRFGSLEAALEDARTGVGEPWRDDEGRRWLSEHLELEPGGVAVWRGGEVSEGVLHWRPIPAS